MGRGQRPPANYYFFLFFFFFCIVGHTLQLVCQRLSSSKVCEKHFFASDRAAARLVRNIFCPWPCRREFVKAPSNLWLRIPYRRNGYPCVFQVQYVDAAILPMVLNPFSILPSEWFRKASLQDFNPKFTIVICVLYIAADIKFHATVFEDQ